MRSRFAAAVLGLLLAFALTAAAKKKGSEPLALISGTVFQSSGFSLPGAKVTAVSAQQRKIKIESQTGQRGEFALRVPAAKGPYIVTAEAKGFEEQQKTAEVYEAEKTMVTFQLSPKE